MDMIRRCKSILHFSCEDSHCNNGQKM